MLNEAFPFTGLYHVSFLHTGQLLGDGDGINYDGCMKKYTTVEEYLGDLSGERLKQVEALRVLIRAAHAGLTEHIKWNSPSFVLDGEDRLTFNLSSPKEVRLIFHMGATRKENKKGQPVLKDDSGVLDWQSDIRAIAAFDTLREIEEKRPVLTKLLHDWLLLP